MGLEARRAAHAALPRWRWDVGVGIAAALAMAMPQGCSCQESGSGSPEPDSSVIRVALDASLGDGIALQQVWLAQTHVQPVETPRELGFAEEALRRHLGRDDATLLRLVGERDVLVKVDLASVDEVGALRVQARILDPSGDERWSAPLTGPDRLPSATSVAPGEVLHALGRSFVAIAPGEHVRTGMELELVVEAETGSWSRRYPVEVGAPTRLPVLMFDFDYFGTRDGRILSDDVVREVGLKLPVREMDVQRIDASMSMATFLPQTQTLEGEEYRAPYIRASSFEEWAAQAEAATGVAWPARNGRSVDHTHVLLGALQQAGAQRYVSALHGNFVDGTRGSFKGRGGSNMLSSSTSSNVLNARNVFVHEFSHSMNLYHWHTQTDGNYPYRGAMFGIAAEGANGTHCGPTWRYREPAYGDGPLGAFVTPTLEWEEGLRYRRVISTSGARDDRAVEFEELVGTFSDWDMRVTQAWLEQQLRVWSPEREAWMRWNPSEGAYATEVRGAPGLDLPVNAEPTPVISVIVAAGHPEANLVYDPVGPYFGGLLRRFDPAVDDDVAAAAALEGYCPADGCDYSIRVTRGGTDSVYMLRVRTSEEALAATDEDAVRHTAINLPVSEGAIERIELLATPNAERVGIPSAPEVLYRWP